MPLQPAIVTLNANTSTDGTNCLNVLESVIVFILSITISAPHPSSQPIQPSYSIAPNRSWSPRTGNKSISILDCKHVTLAGGEHNLVLQVSIGSQCQFYSIPLAGSSGSSERGDLRLFLGASPASRIL